MQKLTLSVDERVVARAKRYARSRGTSVSRLVEAYLDVIPRAQARAQKASPVVARLRGSLKAGSLNDYHRYLERKYL